MAQITLYPIRLGDRGRVAPGWLVLTDGAARALLTAGEDGEVLFGVWFDRRLRPDHDLMRFADIAEAQAWFQKRLRRGTGRRPRHRLLHAPG